MIYLDNAATTQIDPEVLDAMLPYLKNEFGNAGTVYGLGRRAAEAVAKARRQVADYIKCEPEQIIFTSGGSEANNLVFYGLRPYLTEKNKKHIVTSLIEHDSVLNSVKSLCAKDGFEATYIQPNEDGCIEPFDVRKYIQPHRSSRFSATGIVSIMHMNNETGVVNEIEKIAEACKHDGVMFHTDCVQAAASYLDIDVNKISCDFLSISGHKIHAPKGIGALYVRNPDILSPIIHGGLVQEFGLRGGTENVAGIVALGKACEVMADNLFEKRDYMCNLKSAFLDGLIEFLRKYGQDHIVHVNGDIGEHGKTVNIRFDNVDAETLLLMLDSRGVCVSAGSACRSHESEPSYVLLAMGVDPDSARNSIRVSFSKMNTLDEVKLASEIIADCVNFLH